MACRRYLLVSGFFLLAPTNIDVCPLMNISNLTTNIDQHQMLLKDPNFGYLCVRSIDVTIYISIYQVQRNYCTNSISSLFLFSLYSKRGIESQIDRERQIDEYTYRQRAQMKWFPPTNITSYPSSQYIHIYDRQKDRHNR